MKTSKDKTVNYLVGGAQVLLNNKGKNQISYANYAIAMVNEAENPKHNKQWFTVASE